MYVQDYDEMMPLGVYPLATMAQWFSVMEVVEPYKRNQQLELCPSDRIGSAMSPPTKPRMRANSNS